jgi:putative transcriptional regulator
MPPEPPDDHIAVHLDRLLQQRDMTLTELADRVGITVVNLSVLKTAAPAPSASPPWPPSARSSAANPNDLLSHQT